MIFAALLIIAGVVLRFRWRTWFAAVVASAVNLITAHYLGMGSAMWRDLMAISNRTGNPTPVLWLSLVVLACGVVAPVGIVYLSYRRFSRQPIIAANDRAPDVAATV